MIFLNTTFDRKGQICVNEIGSSVLGLRYSLLKFATSLVEVGVARSPVIAFPVDCTTITASEIQLVREGSSFASLAELLFFSNDVCLAVGTYDNAQLWSMKINCQKSLLAGKNYSLSDRCDNIDLPLLGDLCIPAVSGVGDIFVACVAEQCFNRLEDDASVCSGRGVCTSLDKCDCNYPYIGKECEFSLSVFQIYLYTWLGLLSGIALTLLFLLILIKRTEHYSMP